MASPAYVPPTKRVAAGALLLDDEGRVLLVNPVYKPEWEIPGGLVEANEPPRLACQREVWEEIGLRIEPGALLSVDYRPATGRDSDILRFVFWGGRLTGEQRSQIRLPADELAEWRFCTIDEARALLLPSLGAVVAGCIQLAPNEQTQYVEFAYAP